MGGGAFVGSLLEASPFSVKIFYKQLKTQATKAQ
jgi:hypothetical protein